MPSLRDLQLELVTSLYDGDDGRASSFLGSDGVAAPVSLAIYRNNLREGFRKALALEFPVIVRLVDEAFFRTLAMRYQNARPSVRGDLQHIGRQFAAWLDAQFAATEYRYLGPVAALEWAVQQVATAANARPLNPADLAALPPARHADMRFRPLPSSRLVVTPIPVMAIWAANQPGRSGDCTVDFATGPESVLVARGPDGVSLTRLETPTAALLQDLVSGARLGVACEAFQRRWPDADFSAALRSLCRLPAFTAVGLAP